MHQGKQIHVFNKDVLILRRDLVLKHKQNIADIDPYSHC